MEKCPYCSEQIETNTEKCWFCGNNIARSASHKIFKNDIWFYFSPEWRMGRLEYFCTHIMIMLWCLIISVLILHGPKALWFTGNGTIFFQTISLIAIILPSCYASLMIKIKRFHDLDKSWWFVLFYMIPILWILTSLYLLFFKWTEHDNTFWINTLKK